MNDRSKWGETAESAAVGTRFRGGDPGAAEEVRGRVRKTLAFRGYAIPPEDRRDLEQLVMAQIWEAVVRPDFDPAGGFWGFVEVVVARRCVDWRRRRREEVPLDDAVVGAGPDDSPLEAALHRERADLARRTVEGLPEGCRELLRLCIEESKSYAEAAEILGASEGALRVRMHRCIQRAQRLLGDPDESKKVSRGV